MTYGITDLVQYEWSIKYMLFGMFAYGVLTNFNVIKGAKHIVGAKTLAMLLILRYIIMIINFLV